MSDEARETTTLLSTSPSVDTVSSMMETMQSLLDEDEDGQDDDSKVKKPGVKFNSKPEIIQTRSRKGNKLSSQTLESSRGDNQSEESGVVTTPSDDKAVDEDYDDDDDDEEEEENEKQEKLELAAALELENASDSDDETTFGDEEEGGEDYDRFGRLEQWRVELEAELGIETLLHVYKVIQEFLESEESTMEKGTEVAVELLGPDKAHLFPKLFQLVMSDTAFTDDD